MEAAFYQCSEGDGAADDTISGLVDVAGEGRGGRTATRRCSNTVAGGGEVGSDSRDRRRSSTRESAGETEARSAEPQTVYKVISSIQCNDVQ